MAPGVPYSRWYELGLKEKDQDKKFKQKLKVDRKEEVFGCIFKMQQRKKTGSFGQSAAQSSVRIVSFVFGFS